MLTFAQRLGLKLVYRSGHLIFNILYFHLLQWPLRSTVSGGIVASLMQCMPRKLDFVLNVVYGRKFKLRRRSSFYRVTGENPSRTRGIRLNIERHVAHPKIIIRHLTASDSRPVFALLNDLNKNRGRPP